MPNPASFQIKPKLKLGVQFAEHLATLQDKEEAKRRIDSRKRYNIGCFAMGIVSFFTGVAIWGIIAPRDGRVDPDASFVVLIVFAFIIGIPLLLTKIIRESAIAKEVREIASARLNATYSAEQNAEINSVTKITNQLTTIYKEQPSNVTSLKGLLHDAGLFLDQSDQFFTERAFTPFWDSIEAAMGMLRKFNDRVHLINTSAKQYYSFLEGREHTFPSFPVKSSEIPSPDPFVQRLQQTIARAHRDFQFASIYEQRKTTSAVVAGFRSMQEAITYLRNDIVSSITNLQDSLDSGLNTISSEISELKEQDAKHQEFVEGALDNIQNRRKPRT